MTLGTGGIFGYPRSDTGFGGGIFGRSGFPPLLDPETQQAVNQTAAQPMQPSGPNKWINALQGVGAALRDDPGVYENYQNRQAQQQQFQTRRQDELTNYQRKMQDERGNWLFQQEYEAQHPKPMQPTDQLRNFQAYQAMDPAQRQQFGQYQDVVNPRYTQGPSGTMFIPRTSGAGLPSGYDPNQWEVVDGPQSSPRQDTATPSGSPLQQPQMPQGYQGPSPEQMHQLYRQQFGARGDAMFQEWLRNSQGGR